LEVADVLEVDGIPCVRITARSDGAEQKRLKTAGSERTVPLHSGLLALGWLEYVAQRREAGDRKLFPRLRRVGQQGYGARVSQWFGRWKRARGITSSSLVLHSLRHTVATRLKAADVQDFAISELLGHANASITT